MTDELNRALLLAMGYRLELVQYRSGAFGTGTQTHEKFTDGEDWHCATCGELPDFARDLNELRDGPERMLREAGWTFEIRGDKFDGMAVEAGWWMPGVAGAIALEGAPTEAKARASAALHALEAMREPHDEGERSRAADAGTEVAVGYEREAK